ncbi:hypothetical protein AB0H69_46955 [Streptomyces phaeochromogenes]|uniref:hypothetical protein n=1 Tax=Streptomyces phaeochromogenes TaxID=1923 RepID=UPI0033F26AA5
MPDTATKPGTVTPETAPPEPVLTRPRGRHRKPRPRRILFAVGGLALAAGALSLLRMAPQPTGGDTGVEATDIDPSAAGSTDGPAQDDTGAVPVAAPPTTGAYPSPKATTGPSGSTSTSEPNGLNGRDGRDRLNKPNGSYESYGPAGASTPGAQRGATGPTGPRNPAPNPSGDLQDTVPITPTSPAQPPAAAAPTAPAPTPTSPGAPQNPARPGTGLCVPVVGLCFNGNDSNNR